MNKNFCELLIELNIISQAKVGEKYSLKLKRFQDSNSYITSFLRFFYGEDKEKLLNYLDKVIQEVINILQSNELSEEEKKILIERVQNSKNGLNNLKQTYLGFTDFVSKIETWIIILDHEISKHNLYIDKYLEES